jgi:hypothetical protein
MNRLDYFFAKSLDALYFIVEFSNLYKFKTYLPTKHLTTQFSNQTLYKMSSTLKSHASWAVLHFVCILILFLSGLKQLPLWITVFSIGALTLNTSMGYRAAYLYGKEEARRAAGEEERLLVWEV